VPNRLHGRVGTFGTLCRNSEQSEPIWDLQAKFKFRGPPAEANLESRRYRTYLMKTIFDVASSAWNNPHDEIHSVKRSHASPNMSILRLCATFLRLEILRFPAPVPAQCQSTPGWTRFLASFCTSPFTFRLTSLHHDAIYIPCRHYQPMRRCHCPGLPWLRIWVCGSILPHI
jgi:hypothetical protein